MNIIGNHTANTEMSTLLVLHHSNDTIGMVRELGQDGRLIQTQPDDKRLDTVLRFDSSEDSFMYFYSDFYHRLKNPHDYSFFKVREFEAYETAKDLQEYINYSSSVEKEVLKHYEVSIETVDAFRNKKDWEKDDFDREKSYKKSSVLVGNLKYRYQVDDVNWEEMANLGLDREMLEGAGALESLLKGYKTSMLIPVRFDSAEELSKVNARLQLRLDDNGELVVHVHCVQKLPDFRKKFLGHRFSKEDRINLLSCGNMGRVVELVNPATGEVVSSLISLDKMTNVLFSLRMEFVRIPKVVCGVELSLEQQEILKSGKALYVENMLSKSKKLFNATLQFNAEKQWIEFFFYKTASNISLGKVELEVPTVFRGKYLRQWQMDKLKAGETAYIKGLESMKGKTYQGYMSFDKTIGKILFSFNNPKKK